MIRCFSFLLGFFGTLHASICLNMVVRDNAKHISTCLDSVKPFIDYWVIVDAGSSEETRELVREKLKDIPGELHLRTWTNQKTILNEALDLAKEKGDYLLMIQPTEQLRPSSDFTLFALEKDCYFIKVTEADVDFQRIFLVSTKLNWYWKGSLYPTLLSKEEGSFDLISNAELVSAKTDIEILEESFEQDPMNAGLIFRLAQSYIGIQEYAKARAFYEKRIQLGGWAQEVFWSLYQVANISQNLNADSHEIIENYYKAYLYNPSRAEPLYRLAMYHYGKENFSTAYTLIQQALGLPFPYDDRFFLEDWIYQFGLLAALSDCCWSLGYYSLAKEACNKILAKEKLPPDIRKTIEKNRDMLESCGVK